MQDMMIDPSWMFQSWAAARNFDCDWSAAFIHGASIIGLGWEVGQAHMNLNQFVDYHKLDGSNYPKHKQIHNLVYMGLDNKKKRRILAEAELDYPKNWCYVNVPVQSSSYPWLIMTHMISYDIICSPCFRAKPHYDQGTTNFRSMKNPDSTWPNLVVWQSAS